MILDLTTMTEIIINNPNKRVIGNAAQQRKDLCLHIYGNDLKLALTKIDGFENDTLNKLRIEYARSNKDLMDRLQRPFDKVFSAKGGSIYYNLPEAQEKKARAIANDIYGGVSIRKWIETVWRSHFLDDPNGIIFLEIAKQQDALRLRQEGKSYVYPTYKPITSIYDYLPIGNNIEYIVFEVLEEDKKDIEYDSEKDEQIFRVVDDAFDYYVRRNADETITILKEYSFPNLFQKVPAMLNSDIPNPCIHEYGSKKGFCLSIFDIVSDLAKEFLVKGSIKVTHDFRHAFPKYWEFADDCTTCMSEGVATGLVNGRPCPDCKGTRKKLMTRVSDVKLLEYPRDREQQVVVPNVAGYVSPDAVYQEIAVRDLSGLEESMSFTIWGAHTMQRTEGMSQGDKSGMKTATEIIDEIKPQEDRLYPLTEAAEKRHKFILDFALRVQVAPNYDGSFVNYGKRYMIESPDVLWDKYLNSRGKASISALDDMLMEYFETKFSNDPIKLQINTKLMKVEPFVHNTISEIALLTIPEDDYKAKLFYSEWLSTINQAIILSSDIQTLRDLLYAYSKLKILPKPEPAPGSGL